ncbi:MAG: type II secretion system protein GspE, partial [Myxococcota bacterium]
IEPFLVTASVNCIVAQRLARRLCNECKRKATVDEQALLDIGVDPEEIGTFDVYENAGCRLCNNTGYKGRVALYEVMAFTDPLKEMVINGASTAELKAEALRLGMQTLRMAALNKLKEGTTTIDEVVGNTAPDR